MTAAILQAPVVLPPRHDGDPIQHLSHSSHSLWLSCPDAWRRRYLLGEKFPASTSMFIGTACDSALTAYAEARISGNDSMELGDLLAAYDAGWEPALEDQQQGINWGEDNPDEVRTEGRRLVEHAFTHLLPYIGKPVAAQRKLEFRLSEQHQWTVQGYLDLETERVEIVAIDPHTSEIVQVVAIDGHPVGVAPDGTELQERVVRGVVDYKAKNKLISQYDADKDFQPSLYLTGRALAGDPAEDFAFAVMRRANKSGQVDARITRTIRTPAQMRGTVARMAAMANGIVAFYEKLGPEQPWPYADPTGWKCGPKFCGFFSTCAGGAGL